MTEVRGIHERCVAKLCIKDTMPQDDQSERENTEIIIKRGSRKEKEVREKVKDSNTFKDLLCECGQPGDENTK